MNTSQIVEEVTKYGGRIAVDGDKLKLTAPTPLPATLLDEIRKAKPQLLTELQPIPKGACIGCGHETGSMLTRPNGTWSWMCSGCFDRIISQALEIEGNKKGGSTWTQTH